MVLIKNNDQEIQQGNDPHNQAVKTWLSNILSINLNKLNRCFISILARGL